MEVDDEFGELYTDVMAQFQLHREDSVPAAAAVKATPPHGRSVDPNFDSDDDKTSHLKSGIALAARGGFNLSLDSNSEAAAGIDGLVEKGGNGLGLCFGARVLENGHGLELRGITSFMEDDDDDDDDDVNIIFEKRVNNCGDMVEKNHNNFMIIEDKKYPNAIQDEFTMNVVNDAVVNEMGPEQSIPGLSGRMENPSVPNTKDVLESEASDDDLQIVLNDNSHEPMEMERMQGMIDDENGDGDGEPVVIVADSGDIGHHHHQAQRMGNDQEQGGEEEGCDDMEKDLGDASKASGRGGVDGPAAAQMKMVCSNQSYHNPFSSQFKYVRSGAATLPGVAPGGTTAQIRPPISMGAPAGCGRGDWRPAGMQGPVPMQKGFHPSYGILAMGVKVAGRGYGIRLDFTLPSHKTIFEVDIDSFEEKPWKLPVKDVSDFFNFGLDEDSWRDYCKQLVQLRFEMTMQCRIRVRESGRAEQNYDRELAAAVGSQVNPSENANHGKINAGPDLVRQTSLPVGRPIPVETSSCDRLPSIDTRHQRMHDMDAIIEIVCHSSMDGDDVAEKQDNDPARKHHVGGGDEIDGLQQDDADHMDSFSPQRTVPRNTVHNHDILREDVLCLPSEINGHPCSDRETGLLHEERSKKGKRHAGSPFMSASENKKEYTLGDLKEESYRSGDGERSPTSSFSLSVGSDRERVVVDGSDIYDASVMDDGSLNMERVERALDPCDRGTCDCEDGDLIYSTKKQKQSSHADSRNQLADGSWRGTNHDNDIIGSRQRDRDNHLKSRSERVDDLRSIRRYEEVHLRRVLAEKDNICHSHIKSSTRGKRVWERIDTRTVMRSVLAAEEKTWISHSGGNEDYKGSSREYHPKDIGWHGDLFKQRDRVENYFSQHRSHEDVFARRNPLINGEKRSRYNKPTSRDECVSYGPDTCRMQENKRKKTSQKCRETDSGGRSFLIPPKRSQGEDGGSVSETANLSGRIEQQSGRGRINSQSSRKHRDDASTDNEQSDSRRGRSKLERWTSHTEKDSAITLTASSSLKKRNRYTNSCGGGSLATRDLEDPSEKIEDNPQPLVGNRDTGPEMNDNDAKTAKDSHLDTVSKLKKRSERFKLPLPIEKYSAAIKKMESGETPLVKTETCLDSEIKSERPARRRRWSSNHQKLCW